MRGKLSQREAKRLYKQCERIRETLIVQGYDVVSVTYSIDEACDPSVGFTVMIKDQKLINLMKDYAYNLKLAQH